MKERTIFLLILISCGMFDSSAQIYSSINYGMDDGLPQSQVTSITQDDYGYLWLGTSTGGLSRFDGKEFVNFTTGHGLLSPAVLSLAWTPDKLWIGTARGLNVMADGKIYQQTILPRLEITKLLACDTMVWVTTSEGGIYRVGSNSGKFYSSQNGFTDKIIVDIEYDSAGTLWILAKGGEIYHFKDENFLHFNTLEDSTAQSILPLASTLMVGTEKGLITYQINGPALQQINTEVPKANVRDIRMYHHERWLVIQNGLLWEHEGEFKWMSSRNGLTNVPIFSIFQDKEGIIWAGANIYGLYKFLRGPFQRYAFPPANFVDVITDIKQFHPDKTFVTTLGKGAFEVHADHSIHPINLPPRARNLSNAVVWKDKILIASFEEGILESSGSTYKPIPNQPTFATPPYFAGTIGNDVFVSDRKSLFVMRDSGLEKVLEGVNAFVIHKTDSGLVLGTDEGLYEWSEGEQRKIITGLAFDRYMITSIVQDMQQNLLIGTLGQGLWIFPKGNIKAQNPIHLLPVDHITFLLFDTNKLYCGTQRGICVFEFWPDLKVKSQKWLNRNNGLTGIETINETAFKHPSGQLWFGTVDGLFMYDTQEQYPIFSKPILSITAVEVSGVPDSVLVKGWFNKIPSVLPTQASTINLEFKAISLLTPDIVQYQYRLMGLSDKWSQPSVQNSIRFTNLASGNYTFEVRAVNELGIELDRKTMPFLILIPFWQSWWFRALVGLSILAMVWIIIRLRISGAMRRQLEVEAHNRQLRRELAKDFHDELGNHLASIISVLQVFKLKASTLPENLSKQFNLLDRHAQELFFGTKDFIASIDPQHETLEWTLLYLRDFGEQLFSGTTIAFGFPSTEPWQHSVKVRSYFSRHLILIFKEAMTNALKHSEATVVTFYVSKTGADLTLNLTDNGKGFDAVEENNSGIGFKSMRERAKKIEAGMAIQSSQAGTTITIKKENYAHWAG